MCVKPVLDDEPAGFGDVPSGAEVPPGVGSRRSMAPPKRPHRKRDNRFGISMVPAIGQGAGLGLAHVRQIAVPDNPQRWIARAISPNSMWEFSLRITLFKDRPALGTALGAAAKACAKR
jgi:hypothetical protein